MTIHLDLLGAQTRYVGTAEKMRTRILESGPTDGRALFLMHGGGGHAETYARNLNRLGAAGVHAVAPDFIWHGLSGSPDFREGNWLRQFTEQILHVMDCEGIERATFEGESLGAWISFDLAMNFPDRVDGIILNTAWGMTFAPGTVREEGGDLTDLRDRSIRALQNPDYASLRTRLEWLVHDPLQVTDELVELRYRLWTRPEVRDSLTRYYERVFTPAADQYLFDEAAMEGISVPTLVLWTEYNPFHGVDAARRLAEIIPGATLEIMPDAGHWPQWENPAEHDRIVLNFLDSL